ncbi:MAG: prolipoprotein diacylglyceryl transferase [Deltaproteobacteria bacterium]|nr:prolipoprotein diacylglyceryl transferase [Deltaproteobacteria bacterium]
MFPFLVKQGDFIIPTFSFMLMMASLVGTFYAYYRAPEKKLSQTVVLDMGIIGTIAGVVGSRLFHVFVEAPRYYWLHPTHIFQIWRGGFVSYGAIILIGISLYLYLRIRKIDHQLYKYMDLMALGFPLVVMMVRIGCIGAGCCYGKPTDFFIHLVFNNPSSDAGYHHPGVPLHASQVYDLLNGLLIFFVLHFIDKKKKFDGQIMWTFLIMYGTIRGLIEFLRGDVDRGVYFGGVISTAQIMGILSVMLGVFMYQYCKKKYPVTSNIESSSSTTLS